MSARISVTDHAVLRWMERSYEIDVPAIRKRICDKVARAIALTERIDPEGEVTVVVDGYRYVVKNHTVITITAVRRR